MVIHWQRFEGIRRLAEFDIVRAMREGGRRGRAVAACLLAALTVAGCNGHSKPTALPSASAPVVAPSAVVPSAPVSPTPPVSRSPVTSSARPAQSVASSPLAGTSALASEFPSTEAQVPAAVQVVRDFFDGVNIETATGNEAAVSKTFTSRCTLCGKTVYGIQQLREANDTVRGGFLHLLRVDSAYPSYDDIVTVQVTETEDGGDQLDAAGNVVRSFHSAAPTNLVFNVNVDARPPIIFQLDREDS